MKNKLFRNCVYASTILFLGFIGLYVYVWFSDFNPDNSESGVGWRSISIGHGAISIAHSNQNSTRTNGQAMFICPEDGGGNFHFTVAKDFSRDMGGCYLYFLNQNMPEEGMMRFATPGDTLTNRTFRGFGIDFGSEKHTASLLGFSNDDRESETHFMGYGIYFRDTNHTVDRKHNWWTLMISLWYPIILFGILPAIFLVKKLRGRKSASTRGNR